MVGPYHNDLVASDAYAELTAGDLEIIISNGGHVLTSFNSNPSTIFGKTHSLLDDSRIKHHPDKYLLERIRAYFNAFTSGDSEAILGFYGEKYTMTDIRKFITTFPSFDMTFLENTILL